jgi:hypothetical protein
MRDAGPVWAGIAAFRAAPLRAVRLRPLTSGGGRTDPVTVPAATGPNAGFCPPPPASLGSSEPTAADP